MASLIHALPNVDSPHPHLSQVPALPLDLALPTELCHLLTVTSNFWIV